MYKVLISSIAALTSFSLMAKPVAPLLQEFLAKNIEVEKLGLNYHLLELNDDGAQASKPWNLSFSGTYLDSQLDSASPTAYDTVAKSGAVNLSKELFSGTSFILSTGLSQNDLTLKSGGTTTNSSEGYQQLTLSQSLGQNFFGQQDRADLKVASLNREAGVIGLSKSTQAQILNFYSTLLKTSLYRSMVDFSEQAYKRGIEHTELVKRRVRDGLREKVDLYQVEMTQRSLWENVIASKKNLLDAEAELTAMLQRKINGDEIFDLMQLNIAHQNVPTAPWEKSLDSKLMVKELEALKVGLKKAEYALIPAIKLAASLKNNGIDEQNSKAYSDGTLGGKDKEMALSLTLSWNIGSQLESINAAKNRAQLMYKEAEAKSAEITYRTELEKLQRQIELIDQQIDSSAQKVQLARQVLKEYDRLYNQGRADLDRLIDAESSLINTENGHVSYLYSREILAANLHFLNNGLVEYLEQR